VRSKNVSRKNTIKRWWEGRKKISIFIATIDGKGNRMTYLILTRDMRSYIDIVVCLCVELMSSGYLATHQPVI
jgi:hypothetical protein